MTRTANAVVIGAGEIVSATPFELVEAGLQRLTVDRGHEAGTGATAIAGCCAVTWLPGLRRDFDVAFRSRKRNSNPESSFSALG